MLLIISKDLADKRKKADAIIGRFAWRISSNVWIWSWQSIRFDIIDELKRQEVESCVLFVWDYSDKPLGFNFCIYGKDSEEISDLGLFLSKHQKSL